MPAGHVTARELDELTDLQLMILSALWRRRNATVSEVFDDLAARTTIARKTIATLLSRLEARGIVERTMIGREASYRATISRKRVLLRRVSGMLGALFDAPPSIGAVAFSGNRIRKGEVKRLRALLRETERDIDAKD